MIQLRGVSNDGDIAEMDEDIVVVCHGSDHSVHKAKGEKILLCSPCQGRGEIWVKGLCFKDANQGNGWVNTGIYGLWSGSGYLCTPCVPGLLRSCSPCLSFVADMSRGAT